MVFESLGKLGYEIWKGCDLVWSIGLMSYLAQHENVVVWKNYGLVELVLLVLLRGFALVYWFDSVFSYSVVDIQQLVFNG